MAADPPAREYAGVRRPVGIALGGGFGHACRVAAARHTLGLAAAADVLVSDSSLPAGLVPGCRLGTPPLALRSDPEGLGEWIARWLADRRPDLVWVDAFPAGVLGELTVGPAADARWELLARRLRWDRYRRRLPAAPPQFDRVWVTEPLEPEQDAWLRAHSRELRPLALIDPEPDPAEVAAVELPERCWLVVHSGPSAELELLLDSAQAAASGLPLVVVAPRVPPELRGRAAAWVTLAPAHPLADRPEVIGVVTAGGASSMRQYAHRRARHVVVPLPRPLDDQAFRAYR